MFQDWLAKQENPNSIYNGTGFDDATIQALYEWFQFRELYEPDRFGVYFNRQAKLVARQYLNYLRVEMIEFDPMVTNYIERELKANELTKNATRNNTTNSTGTTSTSSGGWDATNNTDSSSVSTNTHNDTTNTSETNDTSQTAHNIGVSYNAAQPRTTGRVDGDGKPVLGWTVLSGQNGEDNTTTTVTHATTVGATTNNGGHRDRVDSNSHTDGVGHNDNTTTTTGNGNVTGEGSANGQRKGLTHEIATGRSGEASQILWNSVEYIKKCNAFDWLILQLEDLFKNIYDDYEEEEEIKEWLYYGHSGLLY